MLVHVAYEAKGELRTVPLHLHCPAAHRAWLDAREPSFMTALKQQVVRVASSKRDERDKYVFVACDQFKLVCSFAPNRMAHVLHLRSGGEGGDAGDGTGLESVACALKSSSEEVSAWVFPPDADFPSEFLP